MKSNVIQAVTAVVTALQQQTVNYLGNIDEYHRLNLAINWLILFPPKR